VLTVKWSWRAEARMEARGPRSVMMPALAMTMSRWVRSWILRRFSRAEAGSVGEVLSNLARWRVLFLPVGREVRAREEEEEGSRTPAMRVWFGRERKVVKRPLPMPLFAPVMRIVVLVVGDMIRILSEEI